MKIDSALLTSDLGAVPQRARELEAMGFDGAFSFEGPHEPFMPLLLAAEHTTRLEIATGVAIAFARNPMIVANLAHDLQAFSHGRFILGLGSQIKAHVERRYSSTWSKPAARMREFVQALRAIFDCWNHGTPLKFEGEFYRHTLMPPLFNPGPTGYGAPRIMLGGVGTAMTAVAGEVADIMLVHPFHTQRSIETVTRPALREGLAKSGRGEADLSLACQVLIVTGETEEAMQAAAFATRAQIAFYASTPAYKVVLDAEGWGDIHAELHTLSKTGQWPAMSERISNDMLEKIAVVGTPVEVAAKLKARYGDIAARIGFASPYDLGPGAVRTILQELRS